MVIVWQTYEDYIDNIIYLLFIFRVTISFTLLFAKGLEW